MTNKNHFSSKFESKTTEELRNVINDGDFHEDAKLAATWELERRGELTEEEQQRATKIKADYEQEQSSRISKQRYQTFGRRFVAAIIDGVALWPVGFLLSYLVDADISSIAIIGSLLYNLSPYIYSVLLHGYYGQTLGKMAMGVKVVDVDNEGDIHLKQAFIRDSVPIALMIILFAYSYIMLWGVETFDIATAFALMAPMLFIGFVSIAWTLLEIISMLFNEKSRAIHDRIAGTVVVRTN